MGFLLGHTVKSGFKRCDERLKRCGVSTGTSFGWHLALSKLPDDFFERFHAPGNVARIDALEREIPVIALHPVVVTSHAVLAEYRRTRRCRDRVRAWQPVVKVGRCTETSEAPRRQGATTENRGPRRAWFARWGGNTGSICGRSNTASAGVPAARFPARWGGAGVHRRST